MTDAPTQGNPFVPAAHGAQKARLLFFGPSKSGKTLSSLLVARGLVGAQGRIAVCDTEGGRAALEAGRPELVTEAQPSGFDLAPLQKPYAPSVLGPVISMAHQAGYDVLVIDGLSPFWEGDGGVLQIVDGATAGSKGGNKFTSGWSVGTPEHQKLLAAITHAPIHVICTCRAKQEYILETNDHGKQVPKKIGLKPVQRDGIEYEFDIAGLLMPDHSTVLEARGPFEGIKLDRPGVDFGQKLAAWLGQSSGQANPAPASAPPAPPATPPTPEGDTPPPTPAASENGSQSVPAAFGASPPAASAITQEQIDSLVKLAGEMAAADPDHGDATTRINNIDAYCVNTYGHGVTEASSDEAQKLIEIAETTLLQLREKASA
jgi:DNA polymerase III delta prime subunit